MQVSGPADPMPIRLVAEPADVDPYRAGACNIGPAEVAGRRLAGLVGLAAAGVVALGLLLIDAPPLARVLVFPLLAGGLVTIEQARRRFCVGFAFAGLRNFGPIGSAQSIGDPADRAADRRAALRMVLEMSAVAAAITAGFVLLPIG